NSGTDPVTGLVIEQAGISFLNVNEVTASRGAVIVGNGSFEVLAGTLDPGEVLEVVVTIQPLLTRARTPRVRAATGEAEDDPSKREWSLPFTALRSGRLSVEIPVEATEGDGVLSGGGSVSIAEAEVFDVRVYITASLPERISIPQSVTIPAGETAAVFDLGVI